jgi:hypothetical protein
MENENARCKMENFIGKRIPLFQENDMSDQEREENNVRDSITRAQHFPSLFPLPLLLLLLSTSANIGPSDPDYPVGFFPSPLEMYAMGRSSFGTESLTG